MIALNHVLAGTAIALSVKQPLLVAPLAIASHFILDIIPHFEYPTSRMRLLAFWLFDALASTLALLALSLAAPELALAIIVGGVFAELPDVFWIYEVFIIKRRSQFWYFRFHRIIQWSETQRGIIYEAIYAVLLIALNVWLLPR